MKLVYQEKHRGKLIGDPYTGFACNCCNLFTGGERIPAKCERCGCVEFRKVKAVPVEVGKQ